MTEPRAHWQSKIGFILAAAGSAVGLGNVWKFPYITGENGGGAFVLIYLVCVALVGLPIMTGEVLLGRMTQTSPVGAFRALSSPRSPWQGVGWLGVVAGFVILSFYSVVAGWALHYTYLAVSGSMVTAPDGAGDAFGALYGSPGLNLLWHTIFMGLTVGIVLGGVRRGVEVAARWLMPALFLMLGGLLLYTTTLSGFGAAIEKVFGVHAEQLGAAAVLEALGHSFFTLSIGMGAMLTYGSYLSRNDDAVSSAVAITVLDTGVALMACVIMFAIALTAGQEVSAGPGLVFVTMPVAFGQLPGGLVLGSVFFLLLTFAALTSAISLLEVVAAYFIDEHGYSRRSASLLMGAAVFVVGIPSALSGGTWLFGAAMKGLTRPITGGEGQDWLGFFDYLATNWLLPLGGLGIALFMAWRVGGKARREALAEGSKLGAVPALYLGWLVLLRFLVPAAIVLVMLNALGVLKALGLVGAPGE